MLKKLMGALVKIGKADRHHKKLINQSNQCQKKCNELVDESRDQQTELKQIWKILDRNGLK